MKTNVKRTVPKTHEGAVVTPDPDLYSQLRRAVLACLLFEDTFYESGVSIADRIRTLVHQNKANDVRDLAIEARVNHGLRHVPLLLVREMARGSTEHRALVERTLARITLRPDELAEFLSIYWKSNDGKKTLSAPVKRGLSAAFAKFNDYALAKYQGKGNEVSLRDVLFLSHAKPVGAKFKWTRAERKVFKEPRAELSPAEFLYQQITEGTLQAPDTWEVQLSAGADKKETFLRLMQEKKLGGLAFLRNLRNMVDAGIGRDALLVYAAYLTDTKKMWGIMPWQFVTAARYSPSTQDIVQFLLMDMLHNIEIKLPGRTVVLVDVSGSMAVPLGGKGAATRIDAAGAVGMLAASMCEQCVVYSFSNRLTKVAAGEGLGLIDLIAGSQMHGGTYLAKSIEELNTREQYDRLIVVTDEQSADGHGAPHPRATAYVVNVASYQNGVSYGRWLRIDGWSQAVLLYIAEIERLLHQG